MLPNAPQGRLHALAQAVEACLARHGPGARSARRRAAGPFGESLAPGAIHEWFLADAGASCESQAPRSHWNAPLGAILEIAREAMDAPGEAPRLCVWIGRRCRPFPAAMARCSPSLLRRSIFVDPAGRDERVWAIDLSLRSGAAAVVVADASRLGLTESRRLQLAAEEGGALGLLLRPTWEMGELSAARTRWRIAPAPSADADERWIVELLRCKGVRPTPEEARPWAVQRSHATGHVSVASLAPRRDQQAEMDAPRRQVV